MTASTRPRASTWIDDFRPDDEVFWERTGKRIARRNLIWSIVAENLGFSVWLLWSVVAARLPAAGFPYTTDQLFQLVALPGLVGALLRFPYTFAVARFGGRNWTIASVILLLLPILGLVLAVSDPATPFWWMLLVAASAGVGGGNFASSMANISYFYPDKHKGLALGLNAAGGNIGVSTVQLLVPLVVGWGGFALFRNASDPPAALHLENAGLMWLPFLAIAVWGAVRYMDNLTAARSNMADQLAAVRSRHTWIISWLYIGTFGSFIGYSAALPLLTKTQFPEVTANLAFLGPLVGSVARPFGGYLSDRLGGARVTLVNFVAMGLATFGVYAALSAHSFQGFLAGFLLLFITSGIGNGSTFRMIPSVFRDRHMRRAEGHGADVLQAALIAAKRETAAVLGFAAAIGACGGYIIPRAFGASIKATGGPHQALAWFLVFYASCIVLTWWQYARKPRAHVSTATTAGQAVALSLDAATSSENQADVSASGIRGGVLEAEPMAEWRTRREG